MHLVEFLLPSLIAVVGLIVQRTTWAVSARLTLTELVGIEMGGERVDCCSFVFSLSGRSGRAPRCGVACPFLLLRSSPNTILLSISIQEETLCGCGEVG